MFNGVWGEMRCNVDYNVGVLGAEAPPPTPRWAGHYTGCAESEFLMCPAEGDLVTAALWKRFSWLSCSHPVWSSLSIRRVPNVPISNQGVCSIKPSENWGRRQVGINLVHFSLQKKKTQTTPSHLFLPSSSPESTNVRRLRALQHTHTHTWTHTYKDSAGHRRGGATGAAEGVGGYHFLLAILRFLVANMS